ncbi:MAG: acyl-CoA thioesterase [Gammaproteobacteria bacterium]|nr:acyl-CoA thioesterase [Gammaproteobacteria bacterium]MCP5458379.1 acyl-CoA thioesterase [Gammaproteobacteria bacterium]
MLNSIEKPATAPYTYRRRIHWSHTDAAHIVYTVRFFDYAMEAIENWFQDVVSLDWYRLNLDLHMGTPFVHIDMDFKAPLTPRHDLLVTVEVERLGDKSLSFKVFGKRSDEVDSFEARFTCCMVDNRSMTPISVPERMRNDIQNYIASCEAARIGK